MRAAWIGLGLTGCLPPVARTIEVERHLWQASAALTPAGPVAVGPVADKGEAHLELAGWASPRLSPPGRAREEGASGMWQPQAGGERRLAGGLGRGVELGVSVDLLPGALGAPGATDLPVDELRDDLLFRAGPQLRVQIPLGERFAVEGQADLRLSHQRVLRHIRLDETETAYTVDGVLITEGTSWQAFEERDTLLLPRGGLGLAFRPQPAVHLSLGGLVQTSPWVYGHRVDTWRCVEVQGELIEDCEGPELPRPYEAVVLGTAWLGLGLRLDEGAWLLPRGWVHLSSDAQGLSQATPWGGGASLRLSLR